MYKKLLITLVVFAIYLPACQKSSSAGGGADQGKQFSVDAPVSPNDMAFLFPLSSQGRPQPFVSLSSQRDIPGQGNFERIMNRARAEGVFSAPAIDDPNNWAMVSFRYTPCEFFVGQENPCKEQVRFVYQPMNLTPGEEGTFLDFSLHVTYEFNATESATPSELMAAVYKLREAAGGKTDGQPLSVHPVLVDRIDRANYFNEILNNIWRPFIFDRDPKAITFMGLGRQPDGNVNLADWRFMFGTIDGFGRWNQQLLPDGSGRDIEILTIDPNSQFLVSNIDDNTEFNILTGGRVNESAAAGALLPQVSNEHNVNCASCHTVDNQVLRSSEMSVAANTRLDMFTFDRDQFVTELVNLIGEDDDVNANLISNQFKGGMFSTAAGTPQVGPTPPEVEVVTRMFGYMHGEPVISQRMAFDNGMAVNTMNRAIRMNEVAISSNERSCSGFRKSFAVMSCLFDGDVNTSLDQCVATSCQ